MFHRAVRASFGLPPRPLSPRLLRRKKNNQTEDAPDVNPKHEHELPESVPFYNRDKPLGIKDWYVHHWLGDVSNYSATAEDVWYQLTVTMPFRRVLLLELVAELTLIFGFAIFLTILAAVECATAADSANHPSCSAASSFPML